MAEYPLEVPGFTDEPLWFDAPFIGSPKLMQGDDRAERGDGMFDRLVTTDDGDDVVATIKTRSGGLDLPVLVIDNVTHEPTRAIPFPDMIAALFPIVLVTAGIWGAVMGGAAIMINFPILRSERPYWQRILMVAGTFVLAILGTQVLIGIVRARAGA